MGLTMARKQVALITGMAGGLSQLVGAELVRRGFEVVGVDYRPLPRTLPFRSTVYQANYNKTKIEDVFRRHRPTHVLHLGRVGNLKEQIGKRFDLNVIGSRKVMEQACKYEAQRLVVLSTFHIYGAHPANHIPIDEDDPLRAGSIFPQIADAIQLDGQAAAWIYQHPEVPGVVLRPCNIVGPQIKNAMSRFLRQPTVAAILGFDPMTQFIHQQDLTDAVVAAATGAQVGVFNVAGRDALPWREALRLTGARIVPVPSFVAQAYLGVVGMFVPALPAHLVDFFKYPCVIADQRIRSAFAWEPEIGAIDAVRATARR